MIRYDPSVTPTGETPNVVGVPGPRMHEPGPPRATSVGRPVELAPRNPEPDGRYTWTVQHAPTASEGSVLVPGETSRPDDPVVHLDPDVPGTYDLALEAPDGTHRQRVRVFPDERRETTIRVPVSDLPLPDASVHRVSIMWRHNDRLLARDRPTRDGDAWVYRTQVPPGRHDVGFVLNDDRATEHHCTHTVPGPGRPSVSLSGRVTADGSSTDETHPRLVVTATIEGSPTLDTDPSLTGVDPADVAVSFLVDDRDADPETVAAVESRAVERPDATTRSLSVPLAMLPNDVRIHAVPHAARHGPMATLRVRHRPDGSVSITDPHRPPAWASSPTVYEAYVRSFAGETLPTTFHEIERRIPYLEHLGVDVLWLTPVLASPTDHGYHVTDYVRTAADLGSRAAFESLVDACHDAGIRVLFDLVINHTSRDHPAFQLHAAGVPAYRDYYRRADASADVSGVDWASHPAGATPEYYFNWERIPNLNVDSLAVRAWLLDVVDEWAAVVDGFRADVAWGLPHGFWKEVAARVPTDFLLLDETLPHDPFYGEGEFDVHYDTTLFETLRAIGAGDAPADAIGDALDRARWLGFGSSSGQLRYVENHDEERYLAAHGEAALRAAAAVTFTLPGAPMIYAGQERGNETTRGPFRWHDGDAALTAYHRRLVALRAAEPSLSEAPVDHEAGRAAITVHEGDPERVTAYERGPLLVVVNFAADTATVAVPDWVGRELFDERPVDDRVTVDSVAVLARQA